MSYPRLHLVLLREQVLVDLALLQSVSYIAGALGVSVAAIFYIINLQETRKNRRITFTTNLVQMTLSEDWQRKMTQLLNSEWSSFEDFVKKYDSKVNEDNYVKRNCVLGTFDYLGYVMKEGLIDRNAIYNVSAEPIIFMWMKYHSIIEGYRKSGDYASDTYANFEYIAYEMASMKRLKDASWRTSSYFSEGDYKGAFGRLFSS
jgi:hypothetical protein